MLGSVGQKAKIAHNIRRLERRRSLNMHLASSREFGQSTIEVENISPSKTHRIACLLYTSPSPRDRTRSRMPSSA